jgi:hypothetical protein
MAITTALSPDRIMLTITISKSAIQNSIVIRPSPLDYNKKPVTIPMTGQEFDSEEHHLI